MDDERQSPDPRSPVQPGRDRAIPVAFALAALIGTIYALRDAWPSDADAPPVEDPQPVRSERTLGATPPGGRSAPLAGLISADDYPIEALRNDEQGTAVARLEINEQGRVSKCTISQSSGSASLDAATCRILSTRARFRPAVDGEGRQVADTFTQRITWRLE